jgi:hypothetical protein
MHTQLVLTNLTKTTYNLDAQERKKESKDNKMQVCGLHYLVLNYIFQYSSYSGQRFTLLFHLTHMSQMSNVFIILWQTKIHEYDNTIESKEKL